MIIHLHNKVNGTSISTSIYVDGLYCNRSRPALSSEIRILATTSTSKTIAANADDMELAMWKYQLFLKEN